MKYKVGDKVKIRKDLVPGNLYGRIYYCNDMDKFKDTECVVTDVVDDGICKINDCIRWWSEEMLEPVDDLLEYALEKLGMTKEELEDEMNRGKEDIAFVEQYIKDKKEKREYCNRFNSDCEGCKIKKFKNKYKYKYYGEINCFAIYKYLKEKEQI